MLDEHRIPYRYRDYRSEPLSVSEVRKVLGLLGMGPREVLRRHDRAYKELALDGEESDEELIRLMAENPTLLQRPIGVRDERAALGRPPENLLALASEQE